MQDMEQHFVSKVKLDYKGCCFVQSRSAGKFRMRNRQRQPISSVSIASRRWKSEGSEDLPGEQRILSIGKSYQLRRHTRPLFRRRSLRVMYLKTISSKSLTIGLNSKGFRPWTALHFHWIGDIRAAATSFRSKNECLSLSDISERTWIAEGELTKSILRTTSTYHICEMVVKNRAAFLPEYR